MNRTLPLFLLLSLIACAPQTRPATSNSVGTTSRAATFYQDGTASWYGPNFVGRPTANGEIFDPSQLTAAHQTLPFDTLVRVTHLGNGRSVVVRINDRGPFVGRRVIDLSRAAAERIDMIGSGTARVRLELLSAAPERLSTAPSASLSGFQIASRFHEPGQLLLLRSAQNQTGQPLLVRVVSGDTANADLLLSEEAYRRLGGEVSVQEAS